MPEETVPAKKRRFLKKDYENIAEFVTKETKTRKTLQFRKDHEALWAEVDRQVRMKPMEVTFANPDDAKDNEWKAALEMGDLSTASEVLSADVLRLIFPQDRSWLQPHVNVNFKRLQNRTNVEITDEDIATVQKKADAELRALMTQQHADFGFRARLELSVKEALHHGSFAAEVQWEEMQQYKMGGVFKSAAAPVWTPHSMWNCYPETLNLGVNLIYNGSMIIVSKKSYEWIIRQTNFINLKTFINNSDGKEVDVEIATWFGDITVKREKDDVFLPNMKVMVANKTVIFAQPLNNTTIIFNGYDRVDVRDPYYMSPLVKQSTNHKIVTILSNKFLDNVELKLDPPGTYDGNDPVLIVQGGPKVIPGHMTASKGGAQNVKFLDVGEPSWATEAIQFFQNNIKEGTGVSGTRAGAERQADRITATQIEEESAGSEIRTIDFVGKVETGIKAYCYIQHEMNRDKMTVYKFYNPEMGMPDFEELKKADLPVEAHFDVIGSKGLLSERRRSQATQGVVTFLLGNELTAGLVNAEEVAMQMLMDAGNKNPERLLNISNQDTKAQRQIEVIKQKAEEAIQALKQQLQEMTQKVVEKEMKLTNTESQLKLRGERAEGTETHLREEIRAMKAQIERSTQLLQELGKIKDETEKSEKIQTEIENNQKLAKASADTPKESVETKSEPTVVVNIERAGGFTIERDEAGDMSGGKLLSKDEVVGE